MLQFIFTLAFTALFFYVLWLLFAIVGDMARDRGHNPWPWWLVSLAWSPFMAMFILWVFFDHAEDNDSRS